jgi:hypothetical protein
VLDGGLHCRRGPDGGEVLQALAFNATIDLAWAHDS